MLEFIKNIFFNSKKAKEEADEKARLEAENAEENDYIAILKADTRFQKYILEKRPKAPIARLSDIMSTPQMTADQLEKEVAARKSTVRALQEIFNSIMN